MGDNRNKLSARRYIETKIENRVRLPALGNVGCLFNEMEVVVNKNNIKKRIK